MKSNGIAPYGAVLFWTCVQNVTVLRLCSPWVVSVASGLRLTLTILYLFEDTYRYRYLVEF